MVEFVAADKRKRKDKLCLDCRRKPAKSIKYDLDKPCKPWAGPFDADENPVQWGHKFMSGQRVCGHKDCVEASHIV